MDQRREQVEQIVMAALEFKGPERAARLDSLCGGDAELRREVESLLAYDSVADRFLATPALEVAAQSLAREQGATLAGMTVGPYRIDSLLGSGGMGEVYLGSDTRLRRPVALKFLTSELLNDRAALERFEREARAASALNHPNICVVHDVGDLNGRPFIAMEYLEGQTLRACLASGKLPRGTALEYAAQAAKGLAAAHQRGVVHRDLKPENLWISPEGTVKILDFGLAKVEEPFHASSSGGDSIPTEPGRIMGTVGYMSPEQVRGQAVDHRTDLFALGAILYEMIGGQRAFRGPSPVDTLSAILNQSPAKLAEPGIDRVVRRCLEKNPEQRFQSATEVGTALERLQDTREQAAEGRRRTRRWLLGTGIAAAAAVSLVPARDWIARRWPAFSLRPAAPRITRLAVLPLTNLSSDAEQEYFADGMTDILIADLTQIAALRVVSRTSAMQFKGSKKPLSEIARQLGVDVVVTATVLKSGERVRITAELVDGSSDKSLWAKVYERDVTNVLSMQAEVALAIAGEVQARLTPQEAGRLASSRKINPAALDAYLLGRYHWDRFTEESLLKSIEYYQEAIRLDPEYAAAYSGVAEDWSGLFTVGAKSWDEAIPQARAAVAKALALDDSSAEAHHALGFIYYREWNWTKAEEETRKAMALSPGYSTCYVLACNLFRQRGRVEESIAAAKKGIEVDPLAMITNQMLGSAYLDARQYDLAIAQFQKALELHPNDPTLLYHMGWAYVYKQAYDQGIEAIGNSLALEGADPQLSPDLAYIDALIGKKDETRRILNRLLELARKYPVSPGLIAMVYVALDDRVQGLAWMEKAYQQHSPVLAWLKVDPRFDRIRPDPAFQELMRRVGLM